MTTIDSLQQFLEAQLEASRYMHGLRRVLFMVATHGTAVIMGRGADFLLPPGKKALGLCLVAPLEARARNIMMELSLAEVLAQKHIARAEREQRLWVKRNCHADINDATRYHMVINTALVAQETIVRLVKGMLMKNE